MEKQKGKVILWYSMVNCQAVKWINHNKSQHVLTIDKVIFNETLKRKIDTEFVHSHTHTHRAWLVALKMENS